MASHVAVKLLLHEWHKEKLTMIGLLGEARKVVFKMICDWPTWRVKLGVTRLLFCTPNQDAALQNWARILWARILVLLIGRDGHLDQSEAYDIS